MSKNKYANSAIKEATNIVEKCIRRKTKKSKARSFFVVFLITAGIFAASLLILPYII